MTTARGPSPEGPTGALLRDVTEEGGLNPESSSDGAAVEADLLLNSEMWERVQNAAERAETPVRQLCVAAPRVKLLRRGRCSQQTRR